MPSPSQSAPRVRRKSGYHHGNLRQAAMAAAEKLVLRHGPNGFALSDAAKLTGVVPSALYRHFASKEDLLAAIATDGFRMLREQLQSAGQSAPIDPRAAVEHFGAVYLAFALEHPARFKTMFFANIDKKRHPELLDLACSTFYDLVAVCQALSRQPLVLASSLWAASHGFAVLAVDGELANAGLQADPALTLRFALRSMVLQDPFLDAEALACPPASAADHSVS